MKLYLKYALRHLLPTSMNPQGKFCGFNYVSSMFSLVLSGEAPNIATFLQFQHSLQFVLLSLEP